MPPIVTLWAGAALLTLSLIVSWHVVARRRAHVRSTPLLSFPSFTEPVQVDVPAIGYALPGLSMISAIKACFRYKEMMQEGYTKVSIRCSNRVYCPILSSVSIQREYSSFPPFLAGISLLAARPLKKHFGYQRASFHLDS
jgi:hypothetical protein